MRYRVLIGLGLAGILALPAWAEKMYRCVDKFGKVTYTNVLEDPKQCKEMELSPDISIPPPQISEEEHSRQAAKSLNEERQAELQSKLETEQQALEQAQKALEEQQAVRYGNEKNYQKVLDRLKPYEEAVATQAQKVKSISDEISATQ